MQVRSNRVKLFRVSAELLWDLWSNVRHNVITGRVVEGVPADAKIENVIVEHAPLGISLLLSHPSWDEVTEPPIPNGNFNTKIWAVKVIRNNGQFPGEPDEVAVPHVME